MGISSVQFGTRNDKHIVKLDAVIAKIRDGWYNTVTWNCYDSDGQLKTAIGVYLICDGGYLRWPILICPYQSANVATLEGYFCQTSGASTHTLNVFLEFSRIGGR